MTSAAPRPGKRWPQHSVHGVTASGRAQRRAAASGRGVLAATPASALQQEQLSKGLAREKAVIELTRLRQEVFGWMDAYEAKHGRKPSLAETQRRSRLSIAPSCAMCPCETCCVRGRQALRPKQQSAYEALFSNDACSRCTVFYFIPRSSLLHFLTPDI